MEKYRGVSYHKRDRRYAPRVWWSDHWVWLRTFRTAKEAAQVRDYADRWLRKGNSKPNLSGESLPANVQPADVAGWLLDSGIPAKVLVRRIPPDVLKEAGMAEYEMIAAGLPLRDIINSCTADA